VDPANIAEAVPRYEPVSRYGNPDFYIVDGRRYQVMSSSQGYVERGIASWYGRKFHGRRTSSGETFDMYAVTAAHRSLPLPTYAEVTQLENGRRIVVKINDRGPFRQDRLIDLSYAAAAKLGIIEAGTGEVEVRALLIPAAPPAPQPATHIEVAAQSMPASILDNRMFVQVGAFRDQRNAERMRTRVAGASLDDANIANANKANVWVSQSDEGHGPALYRVRVGPFHDTLVVEKVVQRLGQFGIHAVGVLDY
jgi:rare lipoprotein A